MMDMWRSLKVRALLLDQEAVEVTTRVDWRSCLDISRQIGKLPLRYALARHVRYQTRAKRGFSVPMGDWLRGPLRAIFEEQVLGRREILGLSMNRRALRAMVEEHLTGRVDYGWGLWILLSLALWEDRYYRHRCLISPLSAPRAQRL